MLNIERLNNILERHQNLEKQLAQNDFSGEDYIKCAKEYSALSNIVNLIQQYNKCKTEILDTKALQHDSDHELQSIAQEELDRLNQLQKSLEQQLKIALCPKDEADEKNVIIEIRPAAGGEEAALFVEDVMNMYYRYSESKKWKFEFLSLVKNDTGGYKEVIASVKGSQVFSQMKFESGVHRVQRVPITETKGRIHTSTITVAVLPEAEEVDINLNMNDIRIDTYRASGAGGQHINTTDSAVRLTHIPTGIIVCQQDEKSQYRNKEKAFKILRSRLYNAERTRIQNERSDFRKEQTGTGDRSEKIRTYNFPQNRITDHRINLTLTRLDHILKSGDLDLIITSLYNDNIDNKMKKN